MLSPINFPGSNPMPSVRNLAKCRYSNILSRAPRSRVPASIFLKIPSLFKLIFKLQSRTTRTTELDFHLKLNAQIPVPPAEDLSSTQNTLEIPIYIGKCLSDLVCSLLEGKGFRRLRTLTLSPLNHYSKASRKEKGLCIMSVSLTNPGSG